MIFAHMAVFPVYIRFGDFGVKEADYLATCITFEPQTKVPAGKKYNVMKIAYMMNFAYQGVIFLFSAWIVPQCD